MRSNSEVIGYCSLATLLALYIVGAVSNGVLRHFVQTLPLWFLIVMGLRRREIVKWASLPCSLIWLVLMLFIWLFLLGWSKLISGHFSPVEVAMTLIVGAASLVSLVVGLRWRTGVSWGKGLLTTLIFTLFQIVVLRISFLPSIARDR
jgi:hypothetical protein